MNETTGFVQVCVQVQEENVTLERSVSVNSSTLEVSALGKPYTLRGLYKALALFLTPVLGLNARAVIGG